MCYNSFFSNPNHPVAVDVEWPIYNMSTHAYLELDKDMGDHSKKMYYGARETNFWSQVLPGLMKEDDMTYPCETSGSSLHVTSLAVTMVTMVVCTILLVVV